MNAPESGKNAAFQNAAKAPKVNVGVLREGMAETFEEVMRVINTTTGRKQAESLEQAIQNMAANIDHKNKNLEKSAASNKAAGKPIKERDFNQAYKDNLKPLLFCVESISKVLKSYRSAGVQIDREKEWVDSCGREALGQNAVNMNDMIKTCEETYQNWQTSFRSVVGAEVATLPRNPNTLEAKIKAGDQSFSFTDLLDRSGNSRSFAQPDPDVFVPSHKK